MSLIPLAINLLFPVSMHGFSSPQAKTTMAQFENLRWPKETKPVACCVCDRIFFDNVSLMLHFECHLQDDVFTPKHLCLSLGGSNSNSSYLSKAYAPVSSASRKETPPPVGVESLPGRISFSDARMILLRQAAKSLSCGLPSAFESRWTERKWGTKPRAKKAKRSIPEIIILSDDESSSGGAEIDLDLKL